MQITLVHPYPDPAAHGLRVLSALLKDAGHRVFFINFPDRTGDEGSVAADHSRPRYPRRALDDLCEVAADSDLIGISLMTNYFPSAVEITAALKREFPEKLVIWGGVHPTIRPDECLDHADLAVIGEGEQTLAELVASLDAGDPLGPEAWSAIPGLAYRHEGEVCRTPLAPLETDLDRLPAPDLDTDDQWTLWNGRLAQVTPALFMRMLASATVSAHYGKIGYQTMTTRGCPHSCTYCLNSTLRGMYAGQRYVRFRSVESVIDECAAVLRRFPFVDYMWFSDDVFFARPTADIQRFAELYGEHVGLPFYLLASPTTLREEKYRLLVEAGLHTIQMGIETGSPDTQEVFNRKAMGNDKVLKAANIIARYAHSIEVPYYDLIVDIPWEGDRNRRETLKLISELPRPYRLQLFSLVLYPSTVAYDRARAEGLIADETRQIYDHMYTVRDNDFFNVVLTLAAKGKAPRWLLKAAADERLQPLVDNPLMKPLSATTRAVLGPVKRLRDVARAHRRANTLASQ